MTTVESVERASKWLIVSDGCDGHYIDIFCSWKEALLEGGKHIGIGLVIAVANPIGLTVLGIIAFFIILTLGDIL